MRIFGFEIRRNSDKEENQPSSFVPSSNEDGAINIGNALGGSYGYSLNLEGTVKNESELITKYRSMSLQPEIQLATEEIVNEAISVSSDDKVVTIVLDDVDISDKLKRRVEEEFSNVLDLMDFSNQGYEIFQRWYVDGRLHYHVVIDDKDLKKGIVELRYIDPRQIRLVRETTDTKDPKTRIITKKDEKEYYVFNENGFGVNMNRQNSSAYSQTEIIIAKDSIVRSTSGLLNENSSMILSYLHKAIKPLNQLRTLEDATVIYTLTRAPERRIFYIDVGNLPKAKAEQYLQDMMARHKNKLQYNSDTGEVTDSRKFMTMTEDFWFPRREGNRATEIEPLAGGTSLSENDNLQYFQKKLYKSLSVPISRLEAETMYSFGRVSEMSREEIKFSKFIRRLRNRFSIIFDEILEKQLILKGVFSPEDWDEIKNDIRYDFMKDNYFEELKESELLREKIQTLRDVEDHVGKYFSRAWVRRRVLFMSAEEIAEIKKEIEEERAAGEYKDPDLEDDPGAGSGEEEYAEEPVDNEPDEEEILDDEQEEIPEDESDEEEIPKGRQA